MFVAQVIDQLAIYLEACRVTHLGMQLVRQ